MSTEKRYVFNFWIATVFIYMFINMQDLLGKSIVSSKVQLLLLYVAYGLGVLIAIIYSKFIIRRFIFINAMFVIFCIITTILFGLTTSGLLNDIIYMSFWFVVMLVCHSFIDVLIRSRFIISLMVVFDMLMILSFIIWFINNSGVGGTVYYLGNIGSANAVYFIVCLFPLVFLDIKTYQKVIIFVFSTACILLSAKRTALIVLVFAFSVPYLCKLLFSKGKNKLKGIFALIALSALVIFLYDYLLEKFDLTIFDRFSNITEDGGSGRIDIYKAVIASFKESGFLNKLFGHGFNGVFLSGITYTSAHNDFLEVLYDFGIIGEIFYLCLVVGMISTASKLLKRRAKTSLAVVSAIMVFICMSTTSHLIIYPTYFIYIILFIMMGQSELLGRNEDEGLAH